METLTPNSPSNWFYWFLLGVACAMLIILSGCSCNYHLNRLQKKNCATFRNDTLLVHDTTYTESVKRDTTFYFNQKDTVLIRQGKLVMKYYYHDSIVYMSGECLSDTIYKTIKVPYTQNVFNFDYIKHYRWYIILGLLIIIIIFAIKKFLV